MRKRIVTIGLLLVILTGILCVMSCSAESASKTPLVEGPQTEDYIVFTGVINNPEHRDLYTIGEWSGSKSEVLYFTATVSPSVVNYGYIPRTLNSGKFTIAVQSEEGNGYPLIGGGTSQTIMFNGEPLEGLGEFRLIVTSTDCEWWVKVGSEQPAEE